MGYFAYDSNSNTWIDVIANNAKKLETPRRISITGDSTGNALFDGSSNIAISVTGVKAKQDGDGNVISSTYLKVSPTGFVQNLFMDALTVYGDINISGNLIPKYDSCVVGLLAAPWSEGRFRRIRLMSDNSEVCAIMHATVGDDGGPSFYPLVNETGYLGRQAYKWLGVIAKTFYGDLNGTAANTNAIATIPVYTGTTTPTSTTRVNINGYVYATKMYNAVYNDYAECFIPKENLKYEEIKNRIVEIDNDGKIGIASKLSIRVIGIVSDKYGYLLGGSEEDVISNKKIPVGLSGTLYVYTNDDLDYDKIGSFACSSDDGFATAVKTPKSGTSVGKIIGVDKENKSYKILLGIK